MEQKKSNRIEQISNDFYDDHFIQELETRLETDPLFPGGLIELDDSFCNHNICTEDFCPSHSCGVNECASVQCGSVQCYYNYKEIISKG